jgi:hypothetical protein
MKIFIDDAPVFPVASQYSSDTQLCVIPTGRRPDTDDFTAQITADLVGFLLVCRKFRAVSQLDYLRFRRSFDSRGHGRGRGEMWAT